MRHPENYKGSWHERKHILFKKLYSTLESYMLNEKKVTYLIL